jgi:protein-S-isoprenylcysteine O-methyltransferase Ste14
MCALAARIINFCWGVFVLVWLAAAFTNKSSVYRESAAQRLRYTILIIIAWLLLAKARRLPHPLDLRLFGCNDIIASVAAILCVVGLAFCVWARATLGRNWSGTITLKENHELIVRGPYQIVRHPIYTGLLAMYLATALLLGCIGGFIGVPLVVGGFWIKLRDEEKLMLQQFPEHYAAYQERTRRLIPFVL